MGGLKAGETKEGEFMLYGRFTYFLNLVILPNKYKQGEADPDYLMFVKENEQAAQEPQGGRSPAKGYDPPAREPGAAAGSPPRGHGTGIPRNDKAKTPRKRYAGAPANLPGLPLPEPEDGQPF